MLDRDKFKSRNLHRKREEMRHPANKTAGLKTGHYKSRHARAPFPQI